MTLIALENTAVTATFWSAAVAMVLFLAHLTLKHNWLQLLGRVGMGAALVGSLVTLVARGMIANHVPWSNLFESMIFMMFGTLVFYFIVEVWYKPRYFGVVAAPLVLLLIGGASLLPPQLKGAAPLMPALQSYWIKVHTSAILISYGAFTIAFAASLAYFVFAWRAQREARKLVAPAPQVLEVAAPAEPVLVAVGAEAEAVDPILAQMVGGSQSGYVTPTAAAKPAGPFDKELQFFDELSYRVILLGFPLLMFGIITGAMWANSAWGTYWSWDPKETWSLITWFIYAAYLHARISRDWVGSKAAGLSVVGFVSMIVTYIGVNYLSTGLHSYGFLR